MSKATIPLAKAYSDKALQFPCYVSEKLDGVPLAVTVHSNGDVTACTRQGTPNHSIDHLLDTIAAELGEPGTVVGECTHSTLTAFKDVSGVVRRSVPDGDLRFNIFDCVLDSAPRATFKDRLEVMRGMTFYRDSPVRVCEQVTCECQLEVEHCILRIPEDAEGVVVRSGNALWAPGKRRYDYMKYVERPTVDLLVVGYTKANLSDPSAQDMVGGVVCAYKDGYVTVGAGKMSHAQRVAVWDQWVRYVECLGLHPNQAVPAMLYNGRPIICTVQYKKDPSYSALREPTFQHWRPEKTEPSYD